MMKKWLLLKIMLISRLECKTHTLIMTKMAEISQNWYPIYDQQSRKTIPFGAAHTYIADIREYHPRGALMFKKPWRTSVTMTNSQRRRALLPLYLQTRRILISHVTRVLMYTRTVTAKEFIDIDISGFGRNSDSDMWTFQNCDVETFEMQTGDIKNPPNRASLVSNLLLYFIGTTIEYLTVMFLFII